MAPLGFFPAPAPELNLLSISVGRGPDFATPASDPEPIPHLKSRLASGDGVPEGCQIHEHMDQTNPENPECHESTIECQADLRKL